MTELIISHARGGLHAYKLAQQFSDRDMSFETTLYFDPAAALPKLLGRLGLHGAAKHIARRSHPGIDRRKVHTFPYPDVLYQMVRRATRLQRQVTKASILRNRWFDRHVAARVRRLQPRVVIAHDSAALETFKAARQVGATTILAQAIGHHAIAQTVFDEERRRHPEFAETLPPKLADRWVEDAIEEVRLADHVVGGSEYVRQSVIDVGCPPDRAHVAPYAADTDRFTPRSPTTGDKTRIIFVGLIGARKGIPYLLEAVSHLQRPDVELLLVGAIQGSGNGLKRYAGVYTHIPSVPRDEVPGLMRSADIFVLPSLHEGSAIVVYEAMASGLPVVVTPNSGTVVRDGVEGFIVPNRDVNALADRLRKLVDNPDLRQRMGAAGRKTALHWNWQRYCDTFDALVTPALRRGLSG